MFLTVTLTMHSYTYYCVYNVYAIVILKQSRSVCPRVCLESEDKFVFVCVLCVKTAALCPSEAAPHSLRCPL